VSTDLDRARELLAARLASRLTAPATEWLAAARAEIAREPRAVERHFAAAGRRVGAGAEAASEGAPRLWEPDGPLLTPWSIADAARALLLVESALADASGISARLGVLYQHGSAAERIAVLRALQLFPRSDEGDRVVADALRASAADLFAAAICENLYTSRHLADGPFFQAVLKCFFVGLDVRRVERVVERTNAELSRMLYAYVTEREHAGRPVAAEIWPLIAVDPPAAARDRAEVARARAER
jgi:hypothetical protein